MIYLHGNGGNKLEAERICGDLLGRGVQLFSYDYIGCGNSDGDYLSVGTNLHSNYLIGVKLKADLACIVDHVASSGKVSSVFVYGTDRGSNGIGRSTGAVLALIYAPDDPRIKGLVLDSPSADVKSEVAYMAVRFFDVPASDLDGVCARVREEIKAKIGEDINEVSPLAAASKLQLPAIFIHGEKDRLVPVAATQQIVKVYAGKTMCYFPVQGHNDHRPPEVRKAIGDFVLSHSGAL